MYLRFKEKIFEHVADFDREIPYELTVSETYLVCSLLMAYEELLSDYESMVEYLSDRLGEEALIAFESCLGNN